MRAEPRREGKWGEERRLARGGSSKRPKRGGRGDRGGAGFGLGGSRERERGERGGGLEKVKLTGGPGLSAGERERGRGRRPAGPIGPKVRGERRVLFVFFNSFSKAFSI